MESANVVVVVVSAPEVDDTHYSVEDRNIVGERTDCSQDGIHCFVWGTAGNMAAAMQC